MKKKIVVINKQQPLFQSILLILVILLLLSLIAYFISGTIRNITSSGDTNLTADEEISEFSTPILQRESSSETGTGSTGTTSQQRSTSTTSNTSTTRSTETTTNNDSTTVDENGNFLQDTINEVDTTVDETVEETNLLQPVITGTQGLLQNIFGN